MTHVNGVDFSSWQARIDWHRVKDSGYSFASLKATEGANYSTSSWFTENFNHARQTMMLVGAYHFYDWMEDPVKQAHWFLKHYKPMRGDLIPFLDLEGLSPLPAHEAVLRVAQWLHLVDFEIKPQRCAIYTNPNDWRRNLGSTLGFSGHPLWLAQYGVSQPDTLGGWKPRFWQYGSKLTIDGVYDDKGKPKLSDGDWFLGTMNDLQHYRLV